MDLEKLADYHLWANDRAREIIRGLSEEEFTRDVVPPLGSVKRLCIHMVMAIEYNLLSRVHGEEVDPYEMDDELDAMPVDELMDRWREADLRLRRTVRRPPNNNHLLYHPTNRWKIEVKIRRLHRLHKKKNAYSK